MKKVILAVLVAMSTSAMAEEVVNFATEQECNAVSRKLDQTYATIQDYDGTRLYMSSKKVVNIDCRAFITDRTYDRWGYTTGVKFKSEPKMIVETVEEFDARLTRLADNRNSKDKFIRGRSLNVMAKYGL